MWDLTGSSPELRAALESVSILWGIVPLPAAAAAAGASIPWGAILSALGGLGSSWLGYRGAGRAGERQLEGLDRSLESTKFLAMLQAMLRNRNMERNFGAMVSRAGTNYGTFKLPLLNRYMTGAPSQEQYEASLERRWNPMSDEDIRYLFEHGSLPRNLFSENSFPGNRSQGGVTWGSGRA